MTVFPTKQQLIKRNLTFSGCIYVRYIICKEKILKNLVNKQNSWHGRSENIKAK